MRRSCLLSLIVPLIGVGFWLATPSDEPSIPLDERPAHLVRWGASPLPVVAAIAVVADDPLAVVQRRPAIAVGAKRIPTAVRSVAVQSTAAPVVPDPPSSRPAEPPPSRPAGSYAFHEFRADGSAMRWNPCQTMGYVLNLDQAPPGAAGILARGFSALSSATGIPVAYEGETTDSGYDGRPHVVVSWRHSAETGGALPEGADGAANPIARDDRYVSGVVFFNPDSTLTASLVIHELGHIAGLAHVSDPTEIMGGSSSSSYGDGDRTGLQMLGREKGCL